MKNKESLADFCIYAFSKPLITGLRNTNSTTEGQALFIINGITKTII